MEKYSTPIRYGIIGGIVMCISALLSYLFYNQLFGSFAAQSIYGLLMLGLMIFIPVWGTITYKRQKGQISFGDAFIAGMIIIGITLLFSSTISYVLPNFIDKDYPQQLYEKVKSTTSDSMEKFGAPEDQIEKALERIKLEDFQPTLLRTLRSFGIGLGMGAVLCLIIAAFASRPEKPKPTLNAES
jgi:MFS family permease